MVKIHSQECKRERMQFYLRSSPSSKLLWHLTDILCEARTTTQCEFFTWSSYQRGTLGAISKVFHISILASISSVEFNTAPKQWTTWLHFSQHLVYMIKTRFLSENKRIIKRWCYKVLILMLYKFLSFQWTPRRPLLVWLNTGWQYNKPYSKLCSANKLNFMSVLGSKLRSIEGVGLI